MQLFFAKISMLNIHGICCRWTVRAKTMKSVLDNYANLMELWPILLDDATNSSVYSRISGVGSKMRTYNFLFGRFKMRLQLSICRPIYYDAPIKGLSNV